MRALKAKIQKIKLLKKQKAELCSKLEIYKKLIYFNKSREESRVQQQVLTQPLMLDTRTKKVVKPALINTESSQMKRIMGQKRCFEDSFSVTSEPENRDRMHFSMLETALTEKMSSTCSVSSLETRDPTKVHLPFQIFTPKDCIAKMEFISETASKDCAFNFLGKRILQISSSTSQQLVEDHQLINSIL